MPYGYNLMIEQGDPSFARYATQFIQAYDHDVAGPLVYPSVSSYYKDELTESTLKLAILESLTPEERRRAAKREYHDKMTCFRTSESERRANQRKYSRMLAAVLSWRPPDERAAEVQKTMVRMLTEDLESYQGYYEWNDGTVTTTHLYPHPETGGQWYARRREDLIERISRNIEHMTEEAERVRQHFDWATNFVDSVEAHSKAI